MHSYCECVLSFQHTQRSERTERRARPSFYTPHCFGFISRRVRGPSGTSERPNRSCGPTPSQEERRRGIAQLHHSSGITDTSNSNSLLILSCIHRLTYHRHQSIKNQSIRRTILPIPTMGRVELSHPPLISSLRLHQLFSVSHHRYNPHQCNTSHRLPRPFSLLCIPILLCSAAMNHNLINHLMLGRFRNQKAGR
jgi:hypothetical protein